MAGYEFIFSDRSGRKIWRHAAFWAVLLLHFAFQNIMVGGFNEALRSRSLLESAFYALFFFPVYMVSVYVLIVILLPVYLFKRRFILFFCWLGVLFLLSVLSGYFCGALYIHLTTGVAVNEISFEANKYNVVVNGVFLPITIYGIAGGIKLTKKWYLEQKETERLAKEKIAREFNY